MSDAMPDGHFVPAELIHSFFLSLSLSLFLSLSLSLSRCALE